MSRNSLSLRSLLRGCCRPFLPMTSIFVMVNVARLFCTGLFCWTTIFCNNECLKRSASSAVCPHGAVWLLPTCLCC